MGKYYQKQVQKPLVRQELVCFDIHWYVQADHVDIWAQACSWIVVVESTLQGKSVGKALMSDWKWKWRFDGEPLGWLLICVSTTPFMQVLIRVSILKNCQPLPICIVICYLVPPPEHIHSSNIHGSIVKIHDIMDSIQPSFPGAFLDKVTLIFSKRL